MNEKRKGIIESVIGPAMVFFGLALVVSVIVLVTLWLTDNLAYGFTVLVVIFGFAMLGTAVAFVVFLKNKLHEALPALAKPLPQHVAGAGLLIFGLACLIWAGFAWEDFPRSGAAPVKLFIWAGLGIAVGIKLLLAGNKGKGAWSMQDTTNSSDIEQEEKQ